MQEVLENRKIILGADANGAATAEPNLCMTLGIAAVPPTEITPKIAELMLAQFAYPGQRNLRPWEVARYAAMMRNGEWDYQSIMLVHVGGKTYLVDGQHRLHAIVMSGTTQSFAVLHKVCKSEAEVARQYNNCGGGIARTQKDALQASGIGERLELTSTWFTTYSAAAKIILTEFSSKPTRFLVARNDLHQQAAMTSLNPFFLRYVDATRGAHTSLSRALRWGSTVAVGIVTFQTDTDKANEFWRTLALDAKKLPATEILERYLLPLTGSSGNGSKIHVTRLVAAAWKRFYEKPHARVTKLLPQSVDLPIYIAGSEQYTGCQKIEPMRLPLLSDEGYLNL